MTSTLRTVGARWGRQRHVLPTLAALAVPILVWTVAIGVLTESSLTASEAAQTKSVPVSTQKKKRSFPGAKKVALRRQTVKSKDGKLKLHIELKLPEGFKINPDAPMGFLLETVGESGPVDRSKPSKYQLVKPPKRSFDLLIPVTRTGEEHLRLSMNYYHCQGDPKTGICQTGSVVLDIPVSIDANADKERVDVKYAVPTL